jgi:regulator of chromosome condensation
MALVRQSRHVLQHTTNPSLGAKRARTKPTEAPAVNGNAAKTTLPRRGKSIASHSTCITNFATAVQTGRPKKSDAPAAPAAAPKTAAKRKKSVESDDEDEPEPAAKKTKTKEVKAKVAKPKAEVKDEKPQPKGPRRAGGRKIEINEIRYTEPLKVFVFGEGGNGELGLGAHKKAKDVKRPRYNEALSNMNVVKVATGGMHVVALTQDNKILTWGVNDNGALGRDTPIATVPMKDAGDDSDSDSDDDPTGGLNDAEATPTAVSAEYFPADTVFVDVAAGDSCSFALTTEGAVYGWGTFRVRTPRFVKRAEY